MQCDDITLAKIRLDVARIKTRTRCSALINKKFSVSINVVEEAPCHPKINLGRKYNEEDTKSEVSSDSLDDEVKGDYDNSV